MTPSLNRLGLNVPLAIGTLQWGTTLFDHKVINSKGGCLSDETCRDIVNEIQAAGVTLIDTAEGYGGGTSEKRIGRLFADQQGHNMIFMTKFLPVPWRGSHASLEWAVRNSCEKLQVSCIDVYLLHSPVHWRSIEFWVESVAICKTRGLVKSMGLSNANADQVRRAVQAGRIYGIDIVCNQVHYSLLDYKSQPLQEMEATCRELNVTIVAFSPIGQGLLTDGLTDEKWQANKPAKMLRLKRSDIDPLRSVISDLAKKYDKSMAQIAINWCIRHDVVPLVGCRSLKQAKDSLGSLGWSLEKEDVERLDQVSLDRSTLQSPPWRRALFVSLFGVVNMICRTLDYWGYGNAPALLQPEA